MSEALEIVFRRRLLSRACVQRVDVEDQHVVAVGPYGERAA